jgi:two-component system response regulator HydG
MSQGWPGNVAELKDCLEYAVAASAGPVLRREDMPLKSQHGEPAAEASAPSPQGSKILPLAEVEKQTILRTLERLNGDKVMTARMLGIGKTTLYRKLKEYGANDSWIGRPAHNR